MTKYLLYLICGILLFCGCHSESDLPNTVKRNITLKNNLGNIEISLPAEFDTSKTTVHFADYKGGHKFSFVFCNKEAIQFFADTTGEFGPFNPLFTSITRISFSISQNLYTDTISIKIDESFLEKMKNTQMKIWYHCIILKKEIIKNRDSVNIAVVAHKTVNTKNKTEMINIHAISKIKNNFIEFSFTQANYKNEKLYLEIIECLKGMKYK